MEKCAADAHESIDFCKFRLTRRGNKAKSVAEMGTSMARFRISQMAEGPALQIGSLPVNNDRPATSQLRGVTVYRWPFSPRSEVDPITHGAVGVGVAAAEFG